MEAFAVALRSQDWLYFVYCFEQADAKQNPPPSSSVMVCTKARLIKRLRVAVGPLELELAGLGDQLKLQPRPFDVTGFIACGVLVKEVRQFL